MDVKVFVKQPCFIFDVVSRRYTPVKRRWRREGGATVNKNLEPERIIEYLLGIPYSELYIISKAKYKKTILIGSLGGETFKIERVV